MQKLKFIEDTLRPILNEQDALALESSLNRRYASYLTGNPGGNGGAQQSLQQATPMTAMNERFRIESGAVGTQVQLRICLQSEDGQFGYPVETVVCSQAGESFAEDGGVKELAVMLDFQDAYWSEYFRSERETFVAIDWSEHTYHGYQIYIRGFQRNFRLESAADRLFAEFGTGDREIEPIGPET
jgi:hypothetical protein